MLCDFENQVVIYFILFANEGSVERIMNRILSINTHSHLNIAPLFFHRPFCHDIHLLFFNTVCVFLKGIISYVEYTIKPDFQSLLLIVF